MKNITLKNIIASLKKKGYPLFKGDYNLTLVGVRSKNKNANTFNDVLVVLFKIDKKQHMYCFDMTTDPGVYYRKNPINIDGTAVLAEGHYPSCWQIGAHRGQYYALVQRGEMAVHRDGDRDDDIDVDGAVQRGFFGINLHHGAANRISLKVDKWSAGCQVLADPVDFELLMALVKKSAQKYGPRFSYSLINEADL